MVGAESREKQCEETEGRIAEKKKPTPLIQKEKATTRTGGVKRKRKKKANR